MSMVREGLALETHLDELDLVSAALEAAAEDGELTATLETRREEVGRELEAGDKLKQEGEALGRRSRRERIRRRRAERAQERALRKLWAACMAAADQDKAARVVQLAFPDGLGALLKLAAEAQNAATKTLIAALGEHEVYAGALRAEHVPALQVTADAVDNALAERDKLAVALAGLAERELAWKQRVNTLRTALSGELVALGADRDDPSPRDYARSFFSAE